MVAAAVIGSAVVGGVASSMSSSSAANAQEGAANRATDMQYAASENMRSDLKPYNDVGLNNINNLMAAMGYGADGQINPSSPMQQRFAFTPGDLTKTPGYQFNYDQGMRAVNNSAASRGLGLSGAQLKGATSFVSGLADNTYQNQFGNALNTFNTNYNASANNANRLAGLVQMGQNSAAQTGSAGMNAAANAGNLTTQAGNAAASGIMGVGNAISGTANSVGNMFMMNQLMKNSGGAGLFG